MSDVSPLVERIARALHQQDVEAGEAAPVMFHALYDDELLDYRTKADYVVDALNLEASVDTTITTQDGTRIRTEYIVDGGWTELEKQND